MSEPPPGLIHVVAAAVTDSAGRILIAQRPVGKQLAGGWEFPGGKIEPGETRVQALTRELHEELGIHLTEHPRPLMRLRHTYPYGEVLLDMWVVRRYGGEPQGMDGQAIRWCMQDELETAAELLAADRPVARALRLPERLTAVATSEYTLGDARTDLGRAEFNSTRLRGAWCSTAEETEAAAHGSDADFVVMRGSLPHGELSALCASIDVPLYARELDLAQAWRLGASGINQI